MADPQAVDALVARVADEFGRVDFLVNNAGASRGGDRVAINGLTTIMAAELGAKKIRVHVVAPGIIDTSRLDDVPRGKACDDMIAAFIPLARAGSGEDLAHLVTFLCSEQGAWITRQHIYVDGGHDATQRRLPSD